MQKFTNDIYLTERTKLLEGILCSSLTFTNSLTATTYAQISISFPNVKGNQNGGIFDRDLETYKEQFVNVDVIKKSNISAPLTTPLFEQVTFLPFDTIGQNIAEAYAQNNPDGVIYESVGGRVTKLTVTEKSGETVYEYPQNDLTIKVSNDVVFSFELDAAYTRTVIGEEITLTKNVIITTQPLSVVQNQYPLKPYTITDCICRCLELCRPLLRGELPQYTLQGVTYSYDENGNLMRTIKGGSQADKYDKIIAPNFSMTQATLRECLQTIGGYIHGEPRLGYDPDGTGAHYEENTVIFDEYGKDEKTSLTEQGYVYRGITQSINDYCTDVSTNVANIVNTLNYTDGVITDPSITTTRTIRTESVNVLMSESNAEIYTQFPIYSIDKVECGMVSGDNPNDFAIALRDITAYIFEAHEYNSRLSSYGGTYPYSKSYALYYTQGQKNIKGLFFKPQEGVDTYLSEYAIANILTAVTGENQNDNITDYWPYLCFRITYTPIYSSKFSHAKGRMQNGNHAYTSIYAQSDNLIETSYYGENIKGVAERLGNVQETRTYVFKDASYIPKTGQILSTPNGDMVITAVTYQMFHTHVRCTVALTKEFNRISQYVGINSQKRISEVSEREAYARDILIKEYAVIGYKQTDTAKLIRNKKVLIGAFVGGDNDAPINAVVAAGTPKKYWDSGETPIYHNGVLLPVVSSAFGNAMVFSWNYKDNYSAGTQLTRNSYKNADNETEHQNWIQDIPYCDYYGRFYWYDFSLSTGLDAEYIKNARAVADGAVASGTTFGYPHKTPNAPIRTSRVEPGVAKYHDPVLVRKDSRETINVNYELEFVSNRNDLIIGSASASKCTLVGTDTERRTAKVYFFANDFKFGKYPKTLTALQANFAYEREIGQDNIVKDENKNPVGFAFDIIPFAFSSWCIAYEPETVTTTYSNEDGETEEIPTTIGGEIVLACNNSSAYYQEQNKTSETIYISTSNTNLKGV